MIILNMIQVGGKCSFRVMELRLLSCCDLADGMCIYILTFEFFTSVRRSKVAVDLIYVRAMVLA